MKINANEIYKKTIQHSKQKKEVEKNKIEQIKKGDDYIESIDYIEKCINDDSDNGLFETSIDVCELFFNIYDEDAELYINLIIEELTSNGFSATYDYYYNEYERDEELDGQFIISWKHNYK